MTRACHDPKSVRATAATLRDLADRIDGLALAMNKQKITGLDINHEQKRRAAIYGLDDWVSDGERKLRNALLP